MAKTRDEKAKELESIIGMIDRVKIAIFTNYNGFSMTDFKELRGRLKKSGNIEYHVTKNNLVKKALSDLKIDSGEKELLTGPVAIAFSYEDEVAPAKTLKEFFKEKDKGVFIGGVYEKKIIGIELVNELASLPSAPELYAKLMGSLKSPSSGIVGVLSGSIRNLIYALSAIANK